LGRFRHAQYDPVTSQLDPLSITFAADADNLMESLMPHGGAEVHWIDSARQLGSGLAIYLREACDRWSLPDVYRTVCSRELYRFCDNAITEGASEYVGARLSRFAGNEASENREIRSIVSTAITRLGFIGNKPIADSLRKSTLDFREMRRRPMTVYVILPGKYLIPYAAWLRTITNSFANACLDEEKGDVPVLGILDEFKTTVGNLDVIAALNSMGAGYGVQLLTVIQNLGQLQELMPRNWETYLANSGFQIFGRCHDWTSSEYLSRMSGDVGVHAPSRTYGRDVNISLGSQSKKFLSPEATRELPDDEMLIFCDGVPGVIRAGRRPYYQSPEFEGKYDADPYHTKKP
jgi:type IV secretion system protein VirD4